MQILESFIESYGPILALTVVLLIIRREALRRLDGRSNFIAEVTLLYAAYFCYFLVRGFVKDQVETAQVNAHRVVDLERHLHLFVEADLQQYAMRFDWLVTFMNWIYVWLHWPVIAVVLIWLFLQVPNEYRLFRNAILISGALSLLIFAFFPVAPPRFMPEFGFVDTIEQRSYSQHVLLPSGLANKYAAMPSLHAGWNLLMGIAIVRNSRRLPFKAIGVALPLLMSTSIVLTGNHYILDFVVGDAIALLGLFLAARFFASEHPTEPPPEQRPGVTVPST